MSPLKFFLRLRDALLLRLCGGDACLALIYNSFDDQKGD